MELIFLSVCVRLCGCLISRLSITFDTFLLLLMFVICYAGVTVVNILARRRLVYGLCCTDCRFVSCVGLEWLFWFLEGFACSFLWIDVTCCTVCRFALQHWYMYIECVCSCLCDVELFI